MTHSFHTFMLRGTSVSIGFPSSTLKKVVVKANAEVLRELLIIESSPMLHISPEFKQDHTRWKIQPMSFESAKTPISNDNLLFFFAMYIHVHQ